MFAIYSLYVHYIFTIYNIQMGKAVASARVITCYPAIIYISEFVHYMFTICLLYIHYMFTIYSLYTTFRWVKLLPQPGRLPATWLLSTSLYFVHYMFTICLLCIHYMFTIYSLYTTFRWVKLLPQPGRLPATQLLSASLIIWTTFAQELIFLLLESHFPRQNVIEEKMLGK